MAEDVDLKKKLSKKVSNLKYRQKGKDAVNAFKSKPCAICNTCYPPIAMDLHHLDSSSKSGNVSQIRKIKGRAGIMQELTKCAVLCAVCHRLLHAGLVDLECPMSDSN